MKLLLNSGNLADLVGQQPSPLLSKRKLPDSARRDVVERALGKERPGEPDPNGPFAKVERALLSFGVYPPELFEVTYERVPVQEGDTVGLRWLMAAPLSLFYGCRIITVLNRKATDGNYKTMVQYHTLQGHPITGEETYSVEKDGKTGVVTVHFRSWWIPGNVLFMALGPLIAELHKTGQKASMDYLESLANK